MKTILMSIKARHNRNIESGAKKIRIKVETADVRITV